MTALRCALRLVVAGACALPAVQPASADYPARPIRLIVPFVAGAGTMSYPRFAVANIAGAILWVGVCFTAGYLFGQVPVVKNNFSLVVLGIVAVTTLPVVIGVLKSWKKRA